MAGIQEVLQSTSRRLVLMLDELDKPLSLLPGQVFLHLRALVDRYPDRLSYVTGTVVPLPACGREEEEGISEFYELFEEQGIFRLPGLSYEEVRESLQYTAPVNLPEIYRLSGGHPVLTGRVISAATGSRELLPLLKTDPQLRRECRRIWESLVEEEQKALLQWLEGIKSLTATPYLGSLEERGLIRQGQSRPVIFSDLFEEYLREKLEAAAPATGFREVAYDPHRDEVIFDGGARRITLTGNAATLFNYLYLRQSKPWCSKDELISAVWGNAAYSPENLDKLVSDLRQELGDSDKTLIRTIPRKGLVLVGVRGWNTRTSE
jgi:DNA-binding winged helix-turn-helix (wHTH) protein